MNHTGKATGGHTATCGFKHVAPSHSVMSWRVCIYHLGCYLESIVSPHTEQFSALCDQALIYHSPDLECNISNQLFKARPAHPPEPRPSLVLEDPDMPEFTWQPREKRKPLKGEVARTGCSHWEERREWGKERWSMGQRGDGGRESETVGDRRSASRLGEDHAQPQRNSARSSHDTVWGWGFQVRRSFSRLSCLWSFRSFNEVAEWGRPWWEGKRPWTLINDCIGFLTASMTYMQKWSDPFLFLRVCFYVLISIHAIILSIIFCIIYYNFINDLSSKCTRTLPK